METAVYTYDEKLFSDLHKDAYGYRPTSVFWEWLEEATKAEKQALWDSLIDAMERREAVRLEDEKRAIAAFELLVSRTMNNGAKTRADAVAWMIDAELGDHFKGDVEHFEWRMGVPFGYVKKTADKENV